LDEIVILLQGRQALNLDGLNFDDYFSDEEQISSESTLNLILLPFRFLAYILTFSWRHTKFYEFGYVSPTRLPLTVGDLIASKFADRFCKREEIKFMLVN
jgi:hypothetical protein